MQSPKRPKVRQTFTGPFSVINTRNEDSLLGRLMQSSRDLHFEWPLCGHGSNYLHYGLFCAHSGGWLVLLYKAEAAVQVTLMHIMQTEALQHYLCSSVMCQYNGESLELLESGLNVPEKEKCAL